MAAIPPIVVTCARCSGTVEIPVEVRKADRHSIGGGAIGDAPTSAYFTVSSSRVEHTCPAA